MTKNSVSRAFGFALVFLFCGACKSHSPTSRKAAEDSSAATFDPSSARLIGRFDRSNASAPRFAWSATQVEALFSGPTLHATLSDAPAADGTRETDWIDVIVDELPARAIELREGRHRYALVEGLGEGEHRVTLWKRTEAQVGTITLHGFEVAVGHWLRATPPRKYAIEAVGDSITAGFGADGRSEHCRWSARTENSRQSYVAVAARMLNADYTAIAWSAKGVALNADPSDPLTLPRLYPRVIPTDSSSTTSTDDATHTDAIVINLGTNDMFGGMRDGARFVDAYLKLLRTLRSRAPRALLVLALGPMLSDVMPRPMARTTMREWLAQIERMWREHHDTNIASIELHTAPSEGFGCTFHPNTKTHARMGHELAALLRARLGW